MRNHVLLVKKIFTVMHVCILLPASSALDFSSYNCLMLMQRSITQEVSLSDSDGWTTIYGAAFTTPKQQTSHVSVLQPFAPAEHKSDCNFKCKVSAYCCSGLISH